jgi:hypothetical protein
MIGRNLNIDNSFRLQIQNASVSSFTLNLFNLGGNSTTQTNITTGAYSLQSNFFISALTNGVLIAGITFQINQGVPFLVNIPFVIGQTIDDIMTAVNPVVNLQGESGTLTIQQTVGDLTGKRYDIVITTPNTTKVSFSFGDQYTPTYTTATYVTSNPLVTIEGTTNINFIQNSEVGNVYKIMGMNVYSTNPQQVLENIGYASYDVNGDFLSIGATPTVDPWQENAASLHMINVDDFDISTNTQFSYIILPTTEVYLTFNYVKSSMAYMREFDQAFASELRMKFLIEQRNLKSLLYRQAIQTQ